MRGEIEMLDGWGEGIIGFIGAIVSTLLGIRVTTHNKRLKGIEDGITAHDEKLAAYKLEVERGLAMHAAELAAHKLHVSENYAKDQTVQASLARIHQRLDETAKVSDINELRSDIKNLMRSEKKQ